MFAFFQIYFKFNFLEELYKFAYLPIGCGVHQENLIKLFKAALVFFEATRIFFSAYIDSIIDESYYGCINARTKISNHWVT